MYDVKFAQGIDFELAASPQMAPTQLTPTMLEIAVEEHERYNKNVSRF